MEEILNPSEQASEGVCSETLSEINGGKIPFDDENGILESNSVHSGKEFVTPAVGMEFESYDDGYNYYLSYAREAGFSVRVKNSWYKRNSREKYGAVLCCSNQGFKKTNVVNSLRKETRTGCPAVMRMRLVDSMRWRVLEVRLEHNHLLGVKRLKCVKKMGNGQKREILSNYDTEVQPVKMYRTVVIDAGCDSISGSNRIDVQNLLVCPNRLNLRKGDNKAMSNYLCRMQLMNSNFFYLMDLNNDGLLRNVIWVDGMSRAATNYFGDVICFQNTCLVNKYEVPLVAIVGINHHGHSVLLGCGLLAGETKESYVWFFKAWISFTSMNSPKTIITDKCKILQSAVAEVFPTSRHRFSLSLIMQKVPEKLGGLRNYDALRKVLLKTVYETLKPFDFEAAWGSMIQRFGVADNEWLQSLYEDRAQWAIVYLRDTLFMGISSARPDESLNWFFDKYVSKQTTLKEFLDKYELALHRKRKEEVVADMESRNCAPELKTKSFFELQLSKIYTREVFRRFQLEVEEMYSCFGTVQIHINGPIAMFLVKERVSCEGNVREVRDYEVWFNRACTEVQCICSCFIFNGFLCRHAMCVLNFNGMEEIPSKYIISRWKKDYKRMCLADNTSGNSGIMEKGKQFARLYRSAFQVVEEGMLSVDHYKVALQAIEESLDKFHDSVQHR